MREGREEISKSKRHWKRVWVTHSTSYNIQTPTAQATTRLKINNMSSTHTHTHHSLSYYRIWWFNDVCILANWDATHQQSREDWEVSLVGGFTERQSEVCSCSLASAAQVVSHRTSTKRRLFGLQWDGGSDRGALPKDLRVQPGLKGVRR